MSEETVPCECCGGSAKLIETNELKVSGQIQKVYECLCGNIIEKIG